MGGTVGSFDCEGDVAEKDRSGKDLVVTDHTRVCVVVDSSQFPPAWRVITEQRCA